MNQQAFIGYPTFHEGNNLPQGSDKQYCFDKHTIAHPLAQEMLPVLVPSGVFGGDMLRVKNTRGLTYQVTVPAGLRPGEVFQASFPETTAPNYFSRDMIRLHRHQEQETDWAYCQVLFMFLLPCCLFTVALSLGICSGGESPCHYS